MTGAWAWAVLGAWPIVGLLTALVLARRGHDRWSWAVLGVFFGPLTVPLAFHVSRQEARSEPHVLASGRPAGGPLSVLVGDDGSTESREALAHAVEVLGPRIGQLTIARVLDFEAVSGDAGEASLEVRERAERELAARAAEVRPFRPEAVLLGGDPARALAERARQAGDDVLVVGRRGRGLARALLGSTASKLIDASPVPVLVGPSFSTAKRL